MPLGHDAVGTMSQHRPSHLNAMDELLYAAATAQEALAPSHQPSSMLPQQAHPMQHNMLPTWQPPPTNPPASTTYPKPPKGSAQPPQAPSTGSQPATPEQIQKLAEQAALVKRMLAEHAQRLEKKAQIQPPRPPAPPNSSHSTPVTGHTGLPGSPSNKGGATPGLPQYFLAKKRAFDAPPVAYKFEGINGGPSTGFSPVVTVKVPDGVVPMAGAPIPIDSGTQLRVTKQFLHTFLRNVPTSQNVKFQVEKDGQLLPEVHEGEIMATQRFGQGYIRGISMYSKLLLVGNLLLGAKWIDRFDGHTISGFSGNGTTPDPRRMMVLVMVSPLSPLDALVLEVAADAVIRRSAAPYYTTPLLPGSPAKVPKVAKTANK